MSADVEFEQRSNRSCTKNPDRRSVLEIETRRRGWRTYSVQGQFFDVPDRYTLLQCIGKGAFGMVCSAQVKGADLRVAIKKVPVNEENLLEVKRLVREIYLLHHFNHENLVGLKDVLEVFEPTHFDEVYFATDLMDTDLHQIIRSKQTLSEDHIQFFLYQILRGLKAMHSAQVLHRDLKPSNIVVNSNCDLKICDFGLAREENAEMTDYVATRWYRAPELLMQWRCYSAAVDLWSVGCIFAELVMRKPLLPGRNYLDQLHLIIDLVGTPHEEDLQGIGTEKARHYVTRLRPRRPRKDLRQLFSMSSTGALTLLTQLLQFNPAKRPTAPEALAHVYFASLHDAADEPDAPPFSFNIDLNDHKVTVPQLKAAILDVIAKYHPECACDGPQQGEETAPASSPPPTGPTATLVGSLDALQLV